MPNPFLPQSPPSVAPFQPSTSPWDQSFTAGPGQSGVIKFASAVPANVSPIIPILTANNFQIASGTVPQPPLSTWAQTVIQLTMNGLNGGTTFTDQKFGTNANTVNDCTTTTAVTLPFGGSSAHLTGTATANQGISYSHSGLWEFGTNNFTIEGWFQTTPNLSQQYTTLCCLTNNSFSTGWEININSNSAADGLVEWWLRDFSASVPMMVGTVKHNDGFWHHVAMQRAGNLWSLYVDGVLEASVTLQVSITAGTAALVFGGAPFVNRTMNGYLQMWRIVVGAAVYTGASFQVPASAFPTS